MIALHVVFVSMIGSFICRFVAIALPNSRRPSASRAINEAGAEAGRRARFGRSARPTKRAPRPVECPTSSAKVAGRPVLEAQRPRQPRSKGPAKATVRAGDTFVASLWTGSKGASVRSGSSPSRATGVVFAAFDSPDPLIGRGRS